MGLVLLVSPENRIVFGAFFLKRISLYSYL